MSNIYFIKTINGDEIFGQVQMTGNGITIFNPLTASEIPDGEGGVTMGLLSYIPYAKDNSCFISKDFILTCELVSDEYSEFYTLSRYFTDLADQHVSKQITDACHDMKQIINNNNNSDNEDLINLENTSDYVN